MSPSDNGPKPGESEDLERPHEVQRPTRSSKSMHEDVPIWCDCCSCEAEPYWVEAMEEEAMAQGED